MLALPAAAEDPQALAAEVLARFNHEPKVNEVQRQAVRFAHANPSEVASWRKRARLSHLLPEIRFAGDYDIDADDTRTFTSATSEPRQVVGNDKKTGFDLRATWDLNKTVFDPVEVQIRRSVVNASRQRDSLIAEVTKIYFERRRAQVEFLLDEEMNARTRVKKELRIAELTAYLDGLTGAWFSKQLRR
jgi:putative alpha-1,2-mannosidase